MRTPSSLRSRSTDLLRAREDGAVVVDARPRHLYIGEPGVPGTGHIPGALALPYQELVDGATGLFQSPAAIRRLAICGGHRSRPAAGSGDHDLRNRRLGDGRADRPRAVGVSVNGVYDGAWSEWSADPALPVAYGNG